MIYHNVKYLIFSIIAFSMMGLIFPAGFSEIYIHESSYPFSIQYPEGWIVFDENEVYIPGRISKDQGFQFPKLRLGNLDARRDWGHAKDYVEAMHLMLQQQKPDDYVIATGKTHSIKEFLDEAFSSVDVWNWNNYVVIDPKFYRPAEVEYLQGLPTKAMQELGWVPKIEFKQLVKLMMDHDIDEAQKLA